MRWLPVGAATGLAFVSLLVLVSAGGCDFGMTADEAAAVDEAARVGRIGTGSPSSTPGGPGALAIEEAVASDPSWAPKGSAAEETPTTFPGVGHPIIQPPEP